VQARPGLLEVPFVAGELLQQAGDVAFLPGQGSWI
jgi:hypothetical protein